MKKRIRITFNAPTVLTFVMVCFIAALLGVWTNGKSTQSFFMTYHSSLGNPMTYLRFFTHVFGHNGWGHLIGNVSYLLLLGPILEEKYGSQKMLVLIGITAVVTGLVNYVFFRNVGLCGASGVVFAFMILASFTGFKEGEIPLTFILVAVIFIGQQIFEAVTVKDQVSNLSHIIGGFTGGCVGYRWNRKL